jgi:hypothetical protein
MTIPIKMKIKSMYIFSGINIQDTGEELIFNDYEEN